VFAFFVVIHVFICVALVLTVLLQAGKGGGLAGAFGGGGTAQTLFGGRGAATFLSKATSWLAVAFMVMSVLLAVLSSRKETLREGAMQRLARERSAQMPASTSALNPASVDTSGGPAGALGPAAEQPAGGSEGPGAEGRTPAEEQPPAATQPRAGAPGR